MDECKKLQEEYISDAETDIMVTREQGCSESAVWITQGTWTWWFDSSNERILAQSGGHPRSDGDMFYIFFQA